MRAVERLHRALAVYREAIHGRGHGQSKDFHCQVLRDAKAAAQHHPSHALREVYRELAILCLSGRGFVRSFGAAQCHAAALLGVTGAEFKEVAR
jgi:hypothetical protein